VTANARETTNQPQMDQPSSGSRRTMAGRLQIYADGSRGERSLIEARLVRRS